MGILMLARGLLHRLRIKARAGMGIRRLPCRYIDSPEGDRRCHWHGVRKPKNLCLAWHYSQSYQVRYIDVPLAIQED